MVNVTKTLDIYWVGTPGGDGEWVPTKGAALRLARGLYAHPATKAPGIIDRYTLPDGRKLTRAIACALLSGHGFASEVERDVFRKEKP